MFQNLVNWFSRLFGGGKKKKDQPLPNPLPGADAMQITTDGSARANEAVAILKGYIRAPYQITDRRIHIVGVTWDEGRKYFLSRGNKESAWDKNHVGHAYAPMQGFNADYGLIHLIDTKLSQEDRVKWAIHEFAHLAVWHWMLTAEEWTSWRSGNRSPEAFADAFADRMLGKKLPKLDAAFFERLEARLGVSNKAQRL